MGVKDELWMRRLERDPFPNCLFKQPDVNESYTYNLTFPTTITSLCTFFIQDSSGTLTTSLTVNSLVVSGNILQIYAKGGIDATDYRMVFIVCDSTNQVRERLFNLICRDQLFFVNLNPGSGWGGQPPIEVGFSFMTSSNI